MGFSQRLLGLVQSLHSLQSGSFSFLPKIYRYTLLFLHIQLHFRFLPFTCSVWSLVLVPFISPVPPSGRIILFRMLMKMSLDDYFYSLVFAAFVFLCAWRLLEEVQVLLVMNMKAEELVETLQDFEHNGLRKKGIHVFHVASLEYTTPPDFVELLLAGVSKSISAAAVLAKQCYSNEESPKVGFPYTVVIVYGPVINNNNNFLFMHHDEKGMQ
ncbi:hypothetical protein RHMOL_Rhmol06G0029800 [Rhododendron molle]|uniref:Uncharacterized protein n=1 Tax=Rhododendron molle TaxID=49168 RepID=A0ACC0NAF6_RHOML|nr:hypothetical protein RHMOL_Rhmol06G0029800 [Rhododendron molle]